MFQNFTEAKRNKPRRSKIFRSKEEQKKEFQSFLGTKRSKWICSKILQIKRKQTGSIVKKQQQNREKTKFRFSLGTKARSKGFDPKKNKVLTILVLTTLPLLTQTIFLAKYFFIPLKQNVSKYHAPS